MVIQILSKNLDKEVEEKRKWVDYLFLCLVLFLPFFRGFVFWLVNLSTLEKVKKILVALVI